MQKLCEEGRIEGVQRFGRSWMIPKTATKPNDLRRKGGDSHVQPQLETFIRVADAGSFNKAAEELFISPPAVIKQINLLEAQLGLTLFVRTHRGLKLTEAGKSLYQDAKYVIGYCRESVERARAAMQKEENVIRIGTSPMTPVQNMVDLWPKFQEYCPDIKFQMIPFENTPENAREILKNLGKNIDVIAGIFDESMLNYRRVPELSFAGCRCAALYRSTTVREEKAFDDAGFVWGKLIVDAPWLEPLH